MKKKQCIASWAFNYANVYDMLPPNAFDIGVPRLTDPYAEGGKAIGSFWLVEAYIEVETEDTNAAHAAQKATQQHAATIATGQIQSKKAIPGYSQSSFL